MNDVEFALDIVKRANELSQRLNEKNIDLINIHFKEGQVTVYNNIDVLAKEAGELLSFRPRINNGRYVGDAFFIKNGVQFQQILIKNEYNRLFRKVEDAQ